LTRILPRFSFAMPTVADCPFAVFGTADEPFALLPPLLPQPAAASAPTTSAVAPARMVMGVRVMLVPFVG
jgi:hypothetical protein